MARGFASPSILFLNTFDQPERDYMSVMFRELRGRYTQLTELCCGAFVMPSVAVENGWSPSQLQTSDVSLYSAIVGTLLSGGDLDALDIRLDGEPVRATEADEVGRAAELLYVQLLTRMEVKPQVPYWNEVVRDLRERRSGHIDAIKHTLVKLDERLHGLKFQPKDLWAHMAEVWDDPQMLVNVNAPTYKCLEVGHRILTADLRWVEAGTVQTGDVLFGFDADAGQGRSSQRRRYRPSVVLRSETAVRPCVRVILDDGSSVVCTPDHPWLVDNGWSGASRRWVNAEDLLTQPNRGRGRFARYALRAFQVWETGQSFDDGWLSGLYDGEGSLSERSHPSKSSSHALTLAQKEGPVLQRFLTLMAERGFEVGVWAGENCMHAAITETSEILRALGTLRPARLLPRVNGERGCRIIGRSEIVAVESAGDREIQSITTSTGTYIGEGWLMHNSGFERFFDTKGRLTWSEPTYEPFNPDGGCQRIMELFADKKALLFSLQQADAGHSAPGAVFCRFLAPGEYVYLCTNRPEEALALTGGRPVVIPKAPQPYAKLSAPIVPEDHEFGPSDEVQVMAVKGTAALYYRDVWMHKIDFKQASNVVAVAVGGYLIGMFGYDSRTITRPYHPNAKPGKAEDEEKNPWVHNGAMLLTFAVGAPHQTYRLTRLVTAVALSREALEMTVRPEIALRVQQFITVELTKHPEIKGLRGLMKLRYRRPDPKYGYRLVYQADVDQRPLSGAVERWLLKEAAWRAAKAEQAGTEPAAGSSPIALSS